MNIPVHSSTPEPQKIRRVIQAAFFLVFCSALPAAPQEFWVSPQGSDTQGDGTMRAPWQTVTQARDYIRDQRLNVAMGDDIVVNLVPGEYPVAQAIAFGPADSGSDGHAIVYRSSGGPGAARFRGGVRVTGWTKHDAHIWKAPVAPGVTFRTLYENGRRARIARTPNYAPDPRYPGYFGEYLKSESGTETSIIFKAGDLDPARWAPAQRGEIWWWGHQGKYNWGMFPCAIAGIDAANRAISFPKQDSPAAAGERFFVQGFRELLDAPGEYFLDETTGTLFYWPMEGDPDAQEIVAPRVGEIFHLQGGGVGVPVHDLKFVGLSVSETDYTPDSVKQVGPPRAAFFLMHANRIELRDCHLFNLGNLGVRLLQDGAENKIIGCWIECAGEGGIQIWNNLSRAEHPDGRSERHVIRDCRIHDFHEVRTSTHWCGVQLFSVSDTEVGHCEIFNSGRYAISLRGNFSTEAGSGWTKALHPSRGNGFHHLRLWRGGGDSGDMGFLHAAHLNPTGGPNINTWEQIVLHDVAAHPSMNDERPNGIFLDHPASCENQVLRNLKVSAVQSAPFRTNKNPTQSLTNVSWEPGFDESAMDEASIGVTPNFPRAFRLAESTAPTLFRDDERWVALGDSITHHGLYHAFAELYYVTRFPARELTVINSGIGGDRAVGGVRRLEWDVLAAKPTVVSVMFGMNDVDRFLYEEGKTGDAMTTARQTALDVYRENQRALVSRLQQSGAKVILFTPTIFDDTAELAGNVPKQAGLNRGLARFADAVRELASESGASCVDFYEPMDRLNRQMQAANPAFTLVGPDRIHPGAPGHLVMTYLLLRAQRAPSLVSRVTVDAASRRVVTVENGEAEWADAPPAATGAVVFRWRARALPFPVDAAATPARAWVPFDAELNQEILQLSGLKPGRYELSIDGQPLRTWTAEELAAGVNLAVEVGTPQHRQAAEVAKLLRTRHTLIAGNLRFIAMAEHLYGPRDGTSPTATLMEELLAPVPTTWRERPPARSIQDAVEHYVERKTNQAGTEATARKLASEARAHAQPREHLYSVAAVR